MSGKVYDNLSSSKQTFDRVNFLEAINGNVVLRGKNGQRDHVYRIDLIWKRFWRMFDMWKEWMAAGFSDQCYELRQVLEMTGARIQEAMAQRAGLYQQIPAFFTPKASANLTEAMKQLSFK